MTLHGGGDSAGTVISASSVGVSFGSSVALQDVSVCVGEREIVAIVGASGSGKSSLLHCLSGIVHPSRGSVEYRGVSLAGVDDETLSRWRRERFGFVFQFGELVPELSLLENVALPLLFGGISRRRAEAAARDALGELGLRSLAGRRPAQVSGGEMQRAAVARALIARPELVFADEPTGALDSATGRVVLDALIGGARRRSTAVVMVTHDNSVASLADRTIEIRDGRIAAGD
jgi:putative ABC transport system ATP-binding protein